MFVELEALVRTCVLSSPCSEFEVTSLLCVILLYILYVASYLLYGYTYLISCVHNECFSCLCQTVGVSSLFGNGIEEFFQAIGDGVKEYYTVYYPQLAKAKLSQVCTRI